MFLDNNADFAAKLWPRATLALCVLGHIAIHSCPSFPNEQWTVYCHLVYGACKSNLVPPIDRFVFHVANSLGRYCLLARGAKYAAERETIRL